MVTMAAVLECALELVNQHPYSLDLAAIMQPIGENSAKDGEMNLTVTGEQQIGIAKPEIERCGTHMLRPLSSSELSMADDDDDAIKRLECRSIFLMKLYLQLSRLF